MSRSWIFLTFFMFPLILVRIRCLKCYECSDEGEVSCKDFDNAKETFIQECNSTDRGCSTQTRGSKRMRSCWPNQLDDCQEANGIEYCFCSWDLCNGKPTRAVDTSDDEDFSEGSGTQIFSSPSTTGTSVEIVQSASDNSRFKAFIMLISMYAMIV